MRIGVTCRIVQAEGYPEARDALAHDWSSFLAAALPGGLWTPVPNLGVRAVRFAEAWGLDAFIFSGGETPGQAPLRDETEAALLDLAVARGLPVFGVCRGAQFIQTCFGGKLSPCDRSAHVAARHTIDSALWGPRTVNSYHGQSIRKEDLADGLTCLAVAKDSSVEALAHESLPIQAVMWHPEREPDPDPLDIAMLEKLFTEAAP